MIWLSMAWAGRYALDHNHPDLRWKTLDTEHFAIHYPQSRKPLEHPRYLSGEHTAQRLAHVADEVWLRLCTAIETFPEERIHVVILENQDELEGFTLPEQDWIVFSGNPGPELHRMRGRMEWTTDLLAHELAHVLTLKQTSWLSGASTSFGTELGSVVESESSQVGVSVDVLQEIPYWFSEGAAEYWSEAAGYNAWTSSREATLRTSVLDGRLLSEAEWRRSDGLQDWYDPERAYQQGYAFHRWFVEEFGQDAWRAVMRASGRRLRLEWSRVLQEVTGESLEFLKQRFEADLVARVNAHVASRRALGVVEGSELTKYTVGWQADDPRARDRWALKKPREKEEQRESTGTTTLHAAFSADGTWFAQHRSGWLSVTALDEGMWMPFSGTVPDWSMTAAQRERGSRLGMWLPARFSSDFDFVPGTDSLVFVGWEGADRVQWGPETYQWTQLFRVDLSPDVEAVLHKGGKATVATFKRSARRRMTAIPGTLRAVDPSVSPDGEHLAFLQYGDGTTQLMVSRIDGSERRALTAFEDGSWLRGTDWSPDGTQIVFAMHQHHQQNLWVADVETGALHPLTQDRWEEVDPHWAADGAIWFSADVDGVFDIFRRDPTGRIDRMTRTLNGAISPTLTPSGNLLYTQFTGFGWKSYGLLRTEFAWEESTADFGAPGFDGRFEAPAPRLAARYRPLRSITGLAASPLLRIDRQASGLVVPRLGAYLKVRDAVEVNTLVLYGWIGADAYASGTWTWHRLWPDVQVSGGHWVGRLTDEEGKRAVTRGGLSLSFPWRNKWVFSAAVSGYQILTEQDDARLGRAITSRVLTASLSTGDSYALRRSNSRRGVATRTILTHGETCQSGCTPYNRAEVFVSAVDGGSKGKRWIVDLGVGLTDRSPHPEDALRAGGDHPYAIRTGRIQSTVAFPGYAPYALGGKNLVVMGLAYRVPLARELRAVAGPFGVDGIYAQLGGHAGTLTQDGAAPLYMDAVAELRVEATAFGSAWNSALRLGWGRDRPTAPGGPRLMLSLGSGF